MRKIILILSTLILSSCQRKETKVIDVKESRQIYPLHFEIEVESELSFIYNSKTGVLRKLIDPGGKPEVYADTCLFHSQNQLGSLMKSCLYYRLFDYPSNFMPSGFKVVPEPSYKITLYVADLKKQILWLENTDSYAHDIKAEKLDYFIRNIKKWVYNSPEFLALPKHRYRFL